MPPLRATTTAEDASSDASEIENVEVHGSSWVWKHGTMISPGRWRCDICVPRCFAKTFSTKGTTHAATHLVKIHQVIRPTTATDGNAGQTSIGTPRQVNPVALRRAIAEWIVDRRHAIREVEAESFRRLVQYLNPYAVNHVPRKGDTIRVDIIALFQDSKMALAQQLQFAASNIHLSFDLWTSPNFKGMLAIVGHWTAEDYTSRTGLLGIRQIYGQHNGENMAAVVFAVAKEYDILNKLGYFVADGATSNDKALRILVRLLRHEGALGFDAEERRIRCFGHILNRVVKALLFGSNAATLESESSEDADMDEDDYRENQASTWRALGAIGKVHNITKYVRRTPQHREAFINQQLEKLKDSPAFMLRADNDTRWNSTHDMIESALQQEDRIKMFTSSVDKLADDKLTDLEWRELREVIKLLSPFQQWTQYAQGKDSPQGSLSTVLPGMDMLLSHLEKAKKESTPASTAFRSAIEAAWVKLDHYNGLTDSTPVYAVAVVLDPRMKLEYFKRNWKPEWVTDLKPKLRRMYEGYRQENIETDVNPMMDGGNGASVDDSKIDISAWCFGADPNARDDLEEYLAAPLVRMENNKEFDRMQWWVASLTIYPTMARMAFDILSIPAMSVECERVFSKYRP
jgi:hypothetical protein